MINPKELKIGDEVWLAGIEFSKSHMRCKVNMTPVKGYVSRIIEDPWYKGSYFIVISESSNNLEPDKELYRIGGYNYRIEQEPFLFKTREEAVEEYNRKINDELDFLQSLIDKHKNKLIK